ncbi:class I SAM-dependent methyltransferase [Gorillibacterium sp. sgz5001074]|uniref:class I SAM-dependent methyltransferase n=1 Tax=Gorillibacterium sp. sgz5001074 TaxID=3446695 RepID=UPI003F674093
MGHSSTNERAWNSGPYQAWVSRYGEPPEAAEKVKRDPEARLKGLYPYMDGLQGKKVANLLGSHGSKAVAMALLGAEATVVDIASENARYARELAAAAGVPLRYVVSDVLELPPEERTGDYDLVLMEFGILHYFVDLAPLMDVIRGLLKPGGRLLLQDFHPVTTKLISSKGTTANIRKHKVTGDYFDASIREVDVAYGKFLSDEERSALPKVKLRYWNLGEIVTAVARAGLMIRQLVEEPNQSSDVFDKGIPKSFTLVADKV